MKRRINWKRGFARLAGILSILTFMGAVVSMFVAPDYQYVPAEFFRVEQRTRTRWVNVGVLEKESSEDLLLLKNKYPEPEYRITEYTGRVPGDVDIWVTAARALLALTCTASWRKIVNFAAGR